MDKTLAHFCLIAELVQPRTHTVVIPWPLNTQLQYTENLAEL